MSTSEVTTIAALATAPAPAGIAIIRVSGPEAATAIRAIFRSKRSPISHPREMVFGELIEHQTGELIDHALAVYMPGPHSFTGEDVAEFQFHGSLILVQKVLRSLFAFGAVPAEPGEFTKRAFLNGKLDLVQAEAIADLIQASSEQSLKVAGEHLKGRFSKTITQLGEPLREALAELEAALDFPEEDINPEVEKKLISAATQALAEIDTLLSSYSYGHVIREGFRVLLCGRPNAGKSSLLNLLLGTQRAIVSEISGTTRDLIEEQAQLGGFRFVFCDSAGICHSDDRIEKIGVELAIDRINWADLVLFVVDASDETLAWQSVLDLLHEKAKRIWMVTNKIDLNPKAFSKFFCSSTICTHNFYLSAKTQDGLSSLVQALIDEVGNNLGQGAEGSQVITNERQRNCLTHARQALINLIEARTKKLPGEIQSAELREALKALEELIGKTYTEDILGRIFSKFCIGK